MLTLPSSVRIYLAAEPVDLRKSIDGLSAIARVQGHDIYSGHLFVFGGRRRDRIKILVWDVTTAVLHAVEAVRNARRSRWPSIRFGTFRFPSYACFAVLRAPRM